MQLCGRLQRQRLAGVRDEAGAWMRGAREPAAPQLAQRVAAERLGEVAAGLVAVERLLLGGHPVPQPLGLAVTVERVPWG